jgi:AcrR family transcriptional regulator
MQPANKTGQPRRTRLRAEQRRASILDAATEVFAARGYRAGKVSDVAARVGVSEPVIFQRFGSKAALYAAVLDRVAGQIRSELQALVEHYGSASDLLAHALDPAHGTRLHGPASHGVLFADAATLAAEPELNEAARRAVRTVADHLADLVRRGQADGDVQAGLDPQAAAWLLLSVLSTRSLRAAVMPDPHRRESAVTALALGALVSRRPAPLPPGRRDPGRSQHR